MSFVRVLLAYGSLRKCLFSFLIVPLCILMLVTTLFDFDLNGLNLNAHNHKHLPFHQSIKSLFDLGNVSNFTQESNRMQMLEVIHLARKISIDQKCRDKTLRQHLLKPYRKAARFYADKSHKLLYCYIPKVASTNLKRLMLILSGTVAKEKFKSLPRSSIHYNNSMPNFQPRNNAELVQRGLGNYSKFMFVRHPFERLVSAYNNKFANNSSENSDLELPKNDAIGHHRNRNFMLDVGTKIIEKYRKNPSNRSLKEGDDVTIPEFVSYVIDEWKAKRELDVHWKPQVEQCLPCSIKYDFVGKFETLQQDVEFLLHKLKEVEFGQYFKKTVPHSTSALMKQFMEQLTQEQFADISKLYEEDFKLFGYEPNITITIL